MLLGKGTPGMDVMTLAGKLARVIDEKGLDVQAEDLTRVRGRGRRQGDADSGGHRVRPTPHQAGRREDRDPGRPAAARAALRRPEAGAFSLRQHQRRERDSEHPGRVHRPDRPDAGPSAGSLRRRACRIAPRRSSSPTIIPAAAWNRRRPTSRSPRNSRRRARSSASRCSTTSSSTGPATSASWKRGACELRHTRQEHPSATSRTGV